MAHPPSASSDLDALHRAAVRGQWDLCALDWATPPPDHAPARADAERRRTAPFGADRAAWERFDRACDAWSLWQFLHGERGALIAAERLIAVVDDPSARACARLQAADEARHVAVFERFLHDRAWEPHPIAPGLEALLRDSLADARWEITALGSHILVEPLALGAFRAAQFTTTDPLLGQICGRVVADETRHVAFGVRLLRERHAELDAGAIREREVFVCDGLQALCERMLLGGVWERMGVPASEGRAFALADPTLREHRRVVLSRVLAAVRQAGLYTERVRTVALGLGLRGLR